MMAIVAEIVAPDNVVFSTASGEDFTLAHLEEVFRWLLPTAAAEEIPLNRYQIVSFDAEALSADLKARGLCSFEVDSQASFVQQLIGDLAILGDSGLSNRQSRARALGEPVPKASRQDFRLGVLIIPSQPPLLETIQRLFAMGFDFAYYNDKDIHIKYDFPNADPHEDLSASVMSGAVIFYEHNELARTATPLEMWELRAA